MKHLLTIFLLSVTLLHSQITITQNDVALRLNNGVMKNTDFIAKQPVSLPVGTASGNAQVFNFASIPPQFAADSSVQKFYTASAFSLKDSFPGMTHASIDSAYDSQSGTTALSAMVYKLTANGLYSMGAAVRYTNNSGLDSIQVYKTMPGKLILPLPISITTNATSVDTFDLGFAKTITYTRIYADGFGTIQLPSGVTKNALRLVTRNTIVQYVGTTQTGSGNAVSLSYFTKDLDQLELTLEDTTQINGVVPVAELTYTTWSGVTKVKESGKNTPAEFALEQNYPNPFNPTTDIRFSLKNTQKVMLEVYNAIGEKVATLINGEEYSAGSHSVRFNASQLRSGLYYYRLATASGTLTGKMTLLK